MISGQSLRAGVTITAVHTAGGFVVGTLRCAASQIIAHGGDHVKQFCPQRVGVIDREHPVGIFDDTIFWALPIGLLNQQAVRGQLQHVAAARAIARRMRMISLRPE